MIKKLLLPIAIALVFCANTASASVVTSLTNATVLSLPVTNMFSAGPDQIIPGVTWSSESNSSVFGYSGRYGFSGNGYWTQGLSMIGTNDESSTMTLKFDTAIQGVGAFLNWAPGSGQASIAVYDSSKNLIESSAVTFLTNGGYNEGQFLGFSESSASISYFTMTGAYIGAANIAVANVSAVPEPESYAMMLGGLGLLGFMSRRRKAS